MGMAHSKCWSARAALMLNMGGYAEYVCVPQQFLVPIPDGLDSSEAVSVILNGLTAYAVLYRVAKIKAGEKILITGAAGGLGSMLIQLAKLAELEVYGSASTGKLTLVKELGATPIDTRPRMSPRKLVNSGGGMDG